MAGEPYEGYGGLVVTGGAGFSTVTVTNLNDSGAGSLRDALDSTIGGKGNRVVRFQPGLSGILTLGPNTVTLSGLNVTIDGSDAPGVTIEGKGFICDGRNYIVTNLRTRNISGVGVDAFSMRGGAEGWVFDHISAGQAGDEVLSMNADFPGFYASTPSLYGLSLGQIGFVTVQYCILGPCLRPLGAPAGTGRLLMKWGGNHRKNTIHHCILYNAHDRMPRLTMGSGTPIAVDFRNNVIARWFSLNDPQGANTAGTTFTVDAAVNDINNYYAGPEDGHGWNNGHKLDGFFDSDDIWTPLSLTGVFQSGLVRADGGTFAHQGTRASAYPIDTGAEVVTQTAVEAALLTLASAGARPLDIGDLAILDWIASHTGLSPQLAPVYVGCGFGLAGQVI